MIITSFRRLARYNRWMNTRLMEICSTLDDAARRLNRGAPFGSIHGLWNHLLLCDRAWLLRFQGAPVPYSRLDEELFSDWHELQVERARTDDAIDAFVASLSEDRLASTLHFTTLSNPQPRELALWIAVQHFFNHQTHHRGQITALMEQAGLDCGVTDIGRDAVIIDSQHAKKITNLQMFLADGAVKSALCEDPSVLQTMLDKNTARAVAFYQACILKREDVAWFSQEFADNA